MDPFQRTEALSKQGDEWAVLFSQRPEMCGWEEIRQRECRSRGREEFAWLRGYDVQDGKVLACPVNRLRSLAPYALHDSTAYS